MITIKQLRWSNAFSYGPNNVLDFCNAPLTQLVGRNGHGKSSIALILEEVLFNKNSKNIKKADILNRYVRDKSYTIELDFERDGVAYTIKSQRGSTQTVKLYRDGVDISSHTATQTYKHIEQILGFDHKSFAQIVYQSHASSLEFLTAADTARKKFLIEILNLGQYTRAQEVFKEVAGELTRDISTTQAQVNTVAAWLAKYEKTDTSPKQLVVVPELDTQLVTQHSEVSQALSGIENTNRKISQNNTYKQLQAKIELLPIPPKPTLDTAANAAQTKTLQATLVELQKTVRDSVAFVKKIGGLQGTCPSCLQPINTHKIGELEAEQQVVQAGAAQQIAEVQAQLGVLEGQLDDYNTHKAAWERAAKAQEDWEKYHQLIDPQLPTTLLDKQNLTTQLETLAQQIAECKAKITQAEQHNQQASAHNAQVQLVKQQLVDMTSELEQHSAKLHELNTRMSIVGVLNKTFSTTGLVAYKIECLVKDLEELTNEYLVALSDGRFQISFKISASDKLNVIITDNGRDIEIHALSGGERARVNVATLLAIRKLMQTLSSSRINLLILDETVETLDVDGKEKLVEVLLAEPHLNTFLVSHGFTHPLLEKVHVVKTNNISQIEA